MQINELYSLTHATEALINAYITRVEKYISRIGEQFYILRLVDSSGEIQACICPHTYDAIENFNLTANFEHSYVLKLTWKVSGANNSLPLYYIQEIQTQL
jgi:DNA polymerase III alpha subunit